MLDGIVQLVKLMRVGLFQSDEYISVEVLAKCKTDENVNTAHSIKRFMFNCMSKLVLE